MLLSVGGQRGGLYYQFILCGLGYKKHPLTVKKPVFNFWETHKSLPLLSYWQQNWKQMLHSPLLPFELANYRVVKIKISLYISFTPFPFFLPSSFSLFPPPLLSLSSLLQSLSFFLSSPPCFWRNRGGSLMSKSKPRALRKLAKCNTAAIRHDARK